MAQPQEWSPNALREAIQMEVTTGATMQILNQCIANGSMTESIKAIANAANAHVIHLTAQAETNALEINRVLNDCRKFVEQSQAESTAHKEALKLEVDALQNRFRDVVNFVNGVPDTVDELEKKLKDVDGKLKAVTDWCKDNSLDTVPVAVTELQKKVAEIQDQASSRFRELSTEIGYSLSPWLRSRLWRPRHTTERARSQRV